MGGKIALGVAAVVGLLLCGGLMGGCNSQRQEISLRHQLDATKETYKADHDAMWKILAQKAGISQQYGPAQEKLLLAVVEGRKGGNLAKSVQEANPNFDLSLLKDLSQSVEGERKALLHSGKKYQDKVIAYNNLVEDPMWGATGFPGRFFLGGKEVMDVPKLITSSRSTDAAASGKDDDVNLFDKK